MLQEPLKMRMLIAGAVMMAISGPGCFNSNRAGRMLPELLHPGQTPDPPAIQKRGTIDCDLVETTPVVFRDRYTAPHALRYQDGYFYNFYLEAFEGYEMRIVRSPDLVTWEASPLNPVLKASEEDKRIANPRLTNAQRKAIKAARNINNSDIDFCEYKGKLIINYSWGNQQGTEFLAEALFDGSLEGLLKALFPE